MSRAFLIFTLASLVSVALMGYSMLDGMVVA